MSSNDKQAAIYMNAAAAIAAALASDLEAGKLWPGDFSRKLSQVYDNLQKAQSAKGNDR